jgi:hypothetical protein
MRTLAFGALALAAGLAAPAARAADYGYDDFDGPAIVTRRTVVERHVLPPPPVVRREVIVERPVVAPRRIIREEVVVERPRPVAREVIVERHGYGPRPVGYYGYGPDFDPDE